MKGKTCRQLKLNAHYYNLINISQILRNEIQLFVSKLIKDSLEDNNSKMVHVLVPVGERRSSSSRIPTGRGRAGRCLSTQRRLARYMHTRPANFINSRRSPVIESGSSTTAGRPQFRIVWAVSLRTRLRRRSEE